MEFKVIMQELERITLDVLRNYDANPELARRIWNDIIKVREFSIEDKDCYFRQLTGEAMRKVMQEYREFIESTKLSHEVR